MKKAVVTFCYSNKSVTAQGRADSQNDPLAFGTPPSKGGDEIDPSPNRRGEKQ